MQMKNIKNIWADEKQIKIAKTGVPSTPCTKILCFILLHTSVVLANIFFANILC